VELVGGSVQGPLLKRALYTIQVRKVAGNPGQGMPVAAELLAVLVLHLADEVLWRGAVLGFLGGWSGDRLVEAGWDAGAAAGAGPWAGVAAMVAATAGLRVWSRLRAAEGQVDVRRSVPTFSAFGSGADDRMDTAVKAVEEAVLGPFAQARVAAGWFEALQAGLQTAALGSAMVLSGGNLAAPFFAACVEDVLFSAYQRKKAAELQQRRTARSRDVQENLARILKEAGVNTQMPEVLPGDETTPGGEVERKRKLMEIAQQAAEELRERMEAGEVEGGRREPGEGEAGGDARGPGGGGGGGGEGPRGMGGSELPPRDD